MNKYTIIMSILIIGCMTHVLNATYKSLYLSYDGSAFQHVKIKKKGRNKGYCTISLKDAALQDKIELCILFYSDRYIFDHVVKHSILESGDIKMYQFERNKHNVAKAHYRIMCKYNNQMSHCGDFLKVQKSAAEPIHYEVIE